MGDDGHKFSLRETVGPTGQGLNTRFAITGGGLAARIILPIMQQQNRNASKLR